MDLEDLFPSKPGDPLVELARQDLDPMSIEELDARIEALKAEIARVEAHMQRAQTHRSAAEELFKKSVNARPFSRRTAFSAIIWGKAGIAALDCRVRAYDIVVKARWLSAGGEYHA